jgi:hypothetical protein
LGYYREISKGGIVFGGFIRYSQMPKRGRYIIQSRETVRKLFSRFVRYSQILKRVI